VTQLVDGNGLADSASFFYQKLGLVTQTQNADGSFSSAASFGWDVTRNLEIDPTSLPARAWAQGRRERRPRSTSC
jgi:hypothetical protein